MNAEKEGKTFFFFLFCGGIAAVVELVGRWLVNLWLPYTAAIVAGRLAGMLTAFLLFKFAVFKTQGSGRTKQETAWFVLVNALALLQVLVVSVGLADYFFPWLGMGPRDTIFSFYDVVIYPKGIAHFIGVTSTAVTSFFAHKLFTFKKEIK